MSMEVKEAIEKIDATIENQQAAVADDEWAVAPEFDEVSPEKLAEIRGEQAANAEYADPADESTEAPAEPAVEAEAEVTEQEKTPADDKVPAGEAAAPKAESGTEEPEFDESLVAAAGLRDADEAREIFGTPRALEAAVRLMDQRSIGLATEALQRQKPPTETQEDSAPPVTEFKMPAPPDGEEWDEATVAIVKSLHDQFHAALKAQEAKVQEARQIAGQIIEEKKAAELRSYVNEFDGFVGELGPDYEKTFGRGSGFELNPQSVFLQNRVLLDQTAKQLAYGRAQQGLPALPQKELLTRALRVAFPQQQESAIRKEVTREVTQRKALITPRPGGRAGTRPPKTGEAAAADYAERWYAERGMASLPAADIEIGEL